MRKRGLQWASADLILTKVVFTEYYCSQGGSNFAFMTIISSPQIILTFTPVKDTHQLRTNL